MTDDDDVANLAAALNGAAIHLLRRLAREDAAVDVGPAQLSALSVLVFGGPHRISELAEVERVAVPTTSRVVAALEGRGLVSRSPDPEDGRATRIRATRRGVAVLEGARRARLAVLQRGLDALTDRERDVLAEAATLMERLARVRAGR